ncbi:hypothetical protein EJB05_35455 [Eragrostis curvula]|uniref:F-box protein AT5G49610-like beta-propeller domain-containing protein n=1 Tax=Eragrostis curvula TaxID=38414 RepID=A0A5J9U6I1_9POAL|nr:hypothetical protein EJB05_35455 [Eragrostis curvula]
MGAPAPELLDENLEEVLFRLQPDEPADLVRAALVWKRWRHVITDPGFRRKFRQFHRTPPLLGFLGNFFNDSYETVVRFVPTTSFCLPRADADHCRMKAVDSRHGRVLLSTIGDKDIVLVVWDPVTDEHRTLPLLQLNPPSRSWNAAVLCAAHGACDHLDCHRGPFLVSFVASSDGETFIRTYSSENGVWSELATVQQRHHVQFKPSPLVGNSLYFSSQKSATVLEYNLVSREITEIQLPPECSFPTQVLLMATEDGRLGFTGLNKFTLCLWSREVGQDGGARWTQSRHIDLNSLLPVDCFFTFLEAVGFADGLNTIFISAFPTIFAVDLKSCQVKKMSERRVFHYIVPFISFYTPALGPGEVSSGEVLEAGGSSA